MALDIWFEHSLVRNNVMNNMKYRSIPLRPSKFKPYCNLIQLNYNGLYVNPLHADLSEGDNICLV